MTHPVYSIHFEVFDPSEPVPENMRHLLIRNYDCVLRTLIEKTFSSDPYWKYEGRVEIAIFVRSDTRLSIRSRDEKFYPRPTNFHEIQFDPHMTVEEFEANYKEIVRACGLISDAILTFTREQLGYQYRPSYRIVRTCNYD